MVTNMSEIGVVVLEIIQWVGVLFCTFFLWKLLGSPLFTKPEWRHATIKDLEKLKVEIMATVSQSIAAFAAAQKVTNDAIDAAVTGLQGDVDNLNKQIADLQNSPGTLTPADQATLDSLQARGASIAAKLVALDAITPPVAPSV